MAFKAFDLVHSLPLALAAAFLFEALGLGDYFGPVPGVSRLFGGVLLAVCKVFLYAGVWGLLGEMAADRADHFSVRRFLHNARLHWGFFALLAGGVVVAHFILQAAFPRQVPALFLFQALADAAVLMAMAGRVVLAGGAGPSADRRKISLAPAAGAFTLGIYLIYLLGVLLLERQRAGAGPGWMPALLLAKYLQFLLFAAFALWFVPGAALGGPRGKELILVSLIPGRFLHRLYAFFMGEYPAFFVVLKALAPGDYRVREYYNTPWSPRFFRKGALVAITCLTSNSAEAYRIARGFRQAGSTVVMGGPHVTFFPEEALEFCHSVVAGPAEGVWEQVVRDHEAGALRPVYRGSCPPEKVEAVDRYLLTRPPYEIKDFLEIARGCKFSCEFCNAGGFMDGIVRHRPGTVAELLRKVKTEYKEVLFLDYNLYSDPAHLEAVLEAITPVGIGWSGSLSIDFAENERLVGLMKKSGCRAVYIGYEVPGSAGGDQHREGKLALAGRYLELSRRIKAAGLAIKASFIIGFREDPWSSLLRVWQFAFRLSPYVVAVSVLQPMPGSRLLGELVRDGRLIDIGWHDYDLSSVVFDHPRMSSRVLARVMPFYSVALSLTCSVMARWLLLAGIVLAVAVWKLAVVLMELKAFG